MNALHLISHRLLVAAVADQRGFHDRLASESMPAVIECNADLSVGCLDVEKCDAAVPVMSVRSARNPAAAGAAWPF